MYTEGAQRRAWLASEVDAFRQLGRFRGDPWPEPAASLDTGLLGWLGGFATGEGCFMLPKAGSPRFALHLRADDRPLLDALRRLSGVGRVYANGGSESSKPSSTWTVAQHAERLELVRILDAAGIRGRKHSEYAVWRAAVIDWPDADRDEARRALSVARRYVDPVPRPTERSDPRPWLVEVLVEWAAEAPDPPSATAYAGYARERGLPTRNTIARAFGSWHAAMVAAELVDRCVRPVPRRVTSRGPADVEQRREAVVAAVRRLAGELGHEPTVNDFLAFRLEREPGLPSLGTVYRLFPEGWTSVLRAAGPRAVPPSQG